MDSCHHNRWTDEITTRDRKDIYSDIWIFGIVIALKPITHLVAPWDKENSRVEYWGGARWYLNQPPSLLTVP